MYDRKRILDLISQSEPGRALPRALYRDPDVYEFDIEEVFTRSWLMVGFGSELREPGDYFALSIGSSPIVLLRGRDGIIRGFHNTCRHRGSQICANGTGHVRRLTCPYHKWTYDLDGHLVGASRMGIDFRSEEHGLVPVIVRTVAGCIYVALSDKAPDFTPFETTIGPVLRPYRFDEAKVAFQSVLPEKANWKLAMENARECYHCASGHPELKRTFPVAIEPDFTFGEADHTVGYLEKMASLGYSTKFQEGAWWNVGRYPLNPGVESISADGKPVVKRRLIDTDQPEVGGLRWATEPNCFCHALADYALMFTVIPTGPQESQVVSKWLVPKDAVEGIDYTVEGLIDIWTKTNMQDRDLAENNQRGVNSIGYVPGPYSPEAEDLAIRFVNWYREQARAALLGDY